MNVGGELWRKEALYEIMDGKSSSLVSMLQQDPDLKKWRCKANDECDTFCHLTRTLTYHCAPDIEECVWLSAQV